MLAIYVFTIILPAAIVIGILIFIISVVSDYFQNKNWQKEQQILASEKAKRKEKRQQLQAKWGRETEKIFEIITDFEEAIPTTWRNLAEDFHSFVRLLVEHSDSKETLKDYLANAVEGTGIDSGLPVEWEGRVEEFHSIIYKFAQKDRKEAASLMLSPDKKLAEFLVDSVDEPDFTKIAIKHLDFVHFLVR